MPKSHRAFEMREQKDWHFLMSDHCEKALNMQQISPDTHLPSVSTFSHAVFTTSRYRNTDAYQYWYDSILTRLSIKLEDFKQRIQWKALKWPAPPGEINAIHEVFSPGSDYNEEIVFQKTHLPLGFSETMQVFLRLTPKWCFFFKGAHKGFVLIQTFSMSLCGNTEVIHCWMLN